MILSEEERIARRKDSLKKAQDKFRAANRERLNAEQRERMKAGIAKEKAAERMREYRAKNPDLFAGYEAKRVRPEGHQEKFNAYNRQWKKENRDKVSEHAHKRSGKKIGRLPAGSIQLIGDRQKWRCPVCHANLKKTGHHKDHIVPLALGGEHAPENIQLLCPPCNLSKGAKDPIQFMQAKGKLL